MREGLWQQPIHGLQEVPQRGYKFQNILYCGFEAVDLEGLPLDFAATPVDELTKPTHLSSQGRDRTQYRGETVLLCSNAFQAEFFVQCPEQLGNREVKDHLRRHDDGQGYGW